MKPPHQSSIPPHLLPDFLSPFVEQDWFQEIFPDHCLLHWSLCPEEFALLLVQHLRRCHIGPRTQILSALLVLLRQGALGNSEQIRAGLINLLQFSAKPNMSVEEKRFIRELLKALVSLAPDSTDTVVELLTVLAHRELGLQSAVLGLLKAMGVEEAEPWLNAEVVSWHVAAHWLDFWTCKYKDRALFLRGAERKEPPTPVDAMRFFCSVQRENQSRPPPPPPEGRKDTVLLPQHLHRPKPIQRLGETHSLARTRQTRGGTLPPLPHRPLLEVFVPFISLPLPRVSLCPFPCPGDQPYQKGAPRRYFFPEHSYAHSYK
ncbi:hypothetical protein AAFF_G00159970 [Aldrovandia affinis]|uniref:Uncharacterized protein n=1 Tax=Aldrovandia affinis TaxID=143900 RepID=A0AAD7RN79_9TELE|nr:hypothetical protein AAFF_G00159970 [Aldrovandia affinis]